jgi:hypothetical protein
MVLAHGNHCHIREVSAEGVAREKQERTLQASFTLEARGIHMWKLRKEMQVRRPNVGAHLTHACGAAHTERLLPNASVVLSSALELDVLEPGPLKSSHLSTRCDPIHCSGLVVDRQ